MHGKKRTRHIVSYSSNKGVPKLNESFDYKSRSVSSIVCDTHLAIYISMTSPPPYNSFPAHSLTAFSAESIIRFVHIKKEVQGSTAMELPNIAASMPKADEQHICCFSFSLGTLYAIPRVQMYLPGISHFLHFICVPYDGTCQANIMHSRYPGTCHSKRRPSNFSFLFRTPKCNLLWPNDLAAL